MATSIIHKVKFFSHGCRPSLKNRRLLKAFIISMFKNEHKRLDSISFIFTNDKTLLSINKEYLNHDFYTDIITFDLSEKSHPIIADIYISCERIKDNALIHKTTMQEELHRVIFHGVLHLCGYKDKTASELKKMQAKEGFYLSRYFT